MINKTSERLKTRNFFICQYFIFHEQLKFRALLRVESFITSGPDLVTYFLRNSVPALD